MTKEVTISSLPDPISHFDDVLTQFTTELPGDEALDLRFKVLVVLITHTLVLNTHNPLFIAENILFPTVRSAIKAGEQFAKLCEAGGLPRPQAPPASGQTGVPGPCISQCRLCPFCGGSHVWKTVTLT